MNDKLFRTKTPHSVAFDASTKNAVSPHNELDDADKAKEFPDHLVPIAETESINSSPTYIDESSGSLHDNKIASQDSDITDQKHSGIAKVHIKDTRVLIPVDDNRIDASTASIAKEHLNSHMQKVDNEHAIDDKLIYESLEKLQDQVHRLKATHQRANRQKFLSTALKDNYQLIDSNEPTVDRVEYLEKKNIQDHMVKIDDSKLPPDGSITDTINPSQNQLDSNVSVTSDSDETHANSKTADHHLSNELQERINRLKKDMHDVNDALKDIQNHNGDSAS